MQTLSSKYCPKGVFGREEKHLLVMQTLTTNITLGKLSFNICLTHKILVYCMILPHKIFNLFKQDFKAWLKKVHNSSNRKRRIILKISPTQHRNLPLGWATFL